MANHFLTRQQVRELDRRAIEDFGIPGVVLMENAGRGAAELLLRLGIDGKVVIYCGKGNNGGDGLVIARHLDAHGIPILIALLAPATDFAGDAAIQLRIVQRARLPLVVLPQDRPVDAWMDETLQGAGWIVDALFGTGLNGALRAPFDAAVRAINAAPARTLAVDIPSGLDCDLGVPLGETIRADHTATFVAPKTGFANPAAVEWLGAFHVLGIGLPRSLSIGEPPT